MAANNRGGKREGAGRKPGSKSKITKQARATLSELARDYSADAMNTLHKVAAEGQSESARVSAAVAILDRAYGKPLQSNEIIAADDSPVETKEVNIIDLARKMAFIMTNAKAKLQKERENANSAEQ